MSRRTFDREGLERGRTTNLRDLHEGLIRIQGSIAPLNIEELIPCPSNGHEGQPEDLLRFELQRGNGSEGHLPESWKTSGNRVGGTYAGGQG